MYNLFIALGSGLLGGLLVRLLNFSVWACLIPGLIVFFGVYIFLARRVAVKIQTLSSAAQKELSVQPANARDRQQRIDKGLKILEEGLIYDRWQFLVGSGIHAQMGMIKYTIKDWEGAEHHFALSSSRNYMAAAMQAALHFQKRNYPKMEELFENAVRSGKKEGIIWATYAWCLLQLKEKGKALKVMGRAVEANPNDEKLKSGLTALQNDKRLKMKPYEPMWWQFGLEQPPVQMMGSNRKVQFVRR